MLKIVEIDGMGRGDLKYLTFERCVNGYNPLFWENVQKSCFCKAIYVKYNKIYALIKILDTNAGEALKKHLLRGPIKFKSHIVTISYHKHYKYILEYIYLDSK